jgi:hypothetical protein
MIPVHNVDVQGTCKIFLKPECLDSPASDQSGTIMIKKANAGTSPRNKGNQSGTGMI